jgi:hypothetical protein
MSTQARLAAGGVCLSCRIMDLMRDTSLLVLLDFGLKSHSLAIRSHSVPGSISSVSATNCFSAFLTKQQIILILHSITNIKMTHQPDLLQCLISTFSSLQLYKLTYSDYLIDFFISKINIQK